ncbi:MAG: ATP-binding protein [Bacteroidaceae bacterium]|nr:ATP-binding protein [Bacteroidaceae bacterium]
MRFYDRESEQELLRDVLQQSKREARMTVVMGRRRIGKTELSLRCGDETVLYFFVGKKAEALLCQDFIDEITSKLGAPVLGQASRFSEVFRFILQLSETRAFTLIIDEFQNFQKVNPTVFSDMQRDWDLKKRVSHLNLIISGSVFSLMRKIFEDYEEPLFGRADEKISLQPFSTKVLKEILNDFNPNYSNEDLLALFSITGGVAWYVTLLLDRGKTNCDKMLGALTEENSPFVGEGKNILIEEFGTDYVVYFSILTCIASGMKTSAEIKNELGLDNISSYLSRLEDYYGLISKYQPIFAKENGRKVRYQLNDCFLIFWFRFFFKYQALVENKAMKALDAIIRRDYSGVSGLMMERYFMRKFQEEGKYIIGKWWDRRGFNEIDLVVVDPIGKEAWVYELKKDESRYDEAAFKEKVDVMVQQTPELHKMKIHLGLLSKDDM